MSGTSIRAGEISISQQIISASTGALVTSLMGKPFPYSLINRLLTFSDSYGCREDSSAEPGPSNCKRRVFLL